MAIIWYDFSSSVDGTGTYTSPYNGSVTHVLYTGDEARVKSHSIADLTDFTFTGSYEITSANQAAPYIDVPDASLFTVGDICMVDADKTCFRISSIDTVNNKIKMYSGFDRWPATMVWSVTNATFRRIKPTYYPNTSNRIYIKGQDITSPLLVSDGWYSETARVSDQSYITLAAASQATTGLNYFYIEKLGTGSTANFENTCIVSCKASNGARLLMQYSQDNLNVKLHQLWGGQYYGLWPYGISGATINVKYLSTIYGPSGTGGTYGDNHTLIIENYKPYYTYYDNRSGGNNITLRIKNLHTYTISGTVWNYSYKDLDFIYDGAWEVGDSTLPANFQHAGTAEFTPNFSLSNQHAVNYGKVGGVIATTLPTVVATLTVDKVNGVYVESGVINNSTTIFTSDMTVQPMTIPDKNFADRSKVRVKVQDFYFLWDSSKISLNNSYAPRGAASYYRDISNGEEFEVLGSATHDTLNYGIKITKDTTTYKATSPSLKCHMSIYSTTYSNQEFVKAIDVPVNGDGTTAFTVTGWLKADAGMFATGKLEARVVYDDVLTALETIDITAVEAGWAQFSIAFVPSDKQVAQFQLRMHPQAGSKAVWLSDVGIE